MNLTIEDLGALLLRKGATQYGGEPVSQLDHALQCAHLAEAADESPHTVAAALLHDLGHLLQPGDALSGVLHADCDDLHHYVALPFLRVHFSDEVLEPIRLHVDAKRYLCSTDPSYLATLSPVSVRSLQMQGGAFKAGEAMAFLCNGHAQAALRLRRYDDRAKVPGVRTPPLGHYLELIRKVSLSTC